MAHGAPLVWIDYHKLKECGRQIQKECPKFAAFFRPCFLLCLWRNEHGWISINQLFDLVMRQVPNRTASARLGASGRAPSQRTHTAAPKA